ncbi:uncharacterized protein TNCT_689601 [Trichonephila clavata]|uniref:Uncharacterized protein n=1 Tax=Trichonephila clavata TaxID=2740835 RepID=A0A8X6FHB8_TRICU|nr:uncharacterized protein TNCT_689601 [Trichonephila clavata]
MNINRFLISGILICVIVSLTTGNSEEVNKKDKCKQFLKTGNGSFILPFEEKCDTFVYRLECLRDSSIIGITSTLEDFKSRGNRWIEVIFEEFTNITLDTKSLITLEKWIIKPQKNLSNSSEYYFSRTSVLIISISVHGNWSDTDLTFYYKEIEFRDYVIRSSKEAGEITPWVPEEGRKYRPNCVSVFHITKSRDMNASSIHLLLNKLDIDEGVGEYLLIGAGSNPFQGPPPLFISSPQYNREFKINDENAYIVFVAASTRTQYEGFNITWRYNGTKISVKDDNVISKHEDISESMPICIYNTSAALSEFNRSKPFFEFREKLALISSEYAKNNSKHFKINSTQVHIFRISGVIAKDVQSEDLKEGALYVMVKVQGSKEGTAAFKWNQLGDILNFYSDFFSEETRGFKINRCPDQSQKTRWTNVGLYAIVPILCCLFLLIWTWKYNPLSNVFTKNLKMSLQAAPIEESDYILDSNACSIPKMYVTDDQDQQKSLEESSGEEQDSDLEIFNKKEFKKSFKQQTNIKESRSTRSSTRSSKKFEINMAFEDDDGLMKVPKTRKATPEKDHETLKSQESLINENENETKL